MKRRIFDFDFPLFGLSVQLWHQAFCCHCCAADGDAEGPSSPSRIRPDPSSSSLHPPELAAGSSSTTLEASHTSTQDVSPATQTSSRGGKQ